MIRSKKREFISALEAQLRINRKIFGNSLRQTQPTHLFSDVSTHNNKQFTTSESTVDAFNKFLASILHPTASSLSRIAFLTHGADQPRTQGLYLRPALWQIP